MAEKKKGEGKKVKLPSPQKRELQSARRNLRNRSYKSKVATVVRSFKESVQKKDAEAAKVQLEAVFSLMDKGVKTGVYPLNKASRVKSRFTKLATAL